MSSLVKWIAVGFGSLAIIAAQTSPAAAHDELVSNQPAANATLSAPPKELQLKFSEPPLEGTSAVVASGANGPVTLPEPVVSGSTLTVAWPQQQPSGTYEIAWRVTSDDGHPVNGAWSFSYGIASPTSSPTPSPSAVANTSSSSPGTYVLVTVAVIVVLAVLIGSLMIWRRRRD